MEKEVILSVGTKDKIFVEFLGSFKRVGIYSQLPTGSLSERQKPETLNYKSISEKMKIMILIFSFVLPFIFPTISFCIAFDIWETGMSINEVVGLARKHDIPIARENTYHGSTKFNPKLIDDKFYKASALYYRTNISGRGSTVYLRLTEDSKYVREIEVRLSNINDLELFTTEMLNILSQKYGAYKERKDLITRAYDWRPDQFSQVLMRVSVSGASITYTDLRIKDYHEGQKKEKERGLIKKDSRKF